MKKLDLTPQQLEVYRTISRINMAWLTLIVMLVLFTIGLLSFLYSIFWIESQGASKLILGSIDGVLGWSIKAIVGFLFSPKAFK